MKKFTESHEWIEVQGNIGTVGITDFAQKELGSIVYVELPKVGAIVKSGEEVAVLESTKAAADIYSPVSGTIVKVNTQLNDDSELVNRAATSGGWIFQIKLSKPEEFETLKETE